LKWSKWPQTLQRKLANDKHSTEPTSEERLKMAANPDYTKLVSKAEKAVASVSDIEMKRVAFQKVLTELNASTSTTWLDSVSKLIQVLAVVVGVLVSVLSFNATRQKEAHAMELDAEAKKLEFQKYYDERRNESAKRQTEAAKPQLELRQKLYLEAVQAAGVLANPKDHTDEDRKRARTRFRELYVAELSLVEAVGVEKGMVRLATVIDPEMTSMTAEQEATYLLAHALRDSLVRSWGLKTDVVDNPNP
jgi:hypothetical protein